MTGVKEFTEAVKPYLLTQSITALRAYARKVGAQWPSQGKKEEIIEKIIDIFTGKVAPIEKSNQGAPVKNDYVDPKIVDTMEKFRRKFLRPETFTPELLEGMKPLVSRGSTTDAFRRDLAYAHMGNILEVNSPMAEEMEKQRQFEQTIYVGQIEFKNDCCWAIPKQIEGQTKEILIPPELVEKHDLREGDIVSCLAQISKSVYVAAQIKALNYMPISCLEPTPRIHFDEEMPSYPTEKLHFISPRELNSKTTDKIFEWLLPIKRGQRVCIVAPPKTGKTSLVYHLANLIGTHSREVRVFVLLVDQALETVIQFKQGLKNADFMYTTYENDCDEHVWTAQSMLNRAKRYVESGKHVVFLVDSLNSIAHAFNETDASTGGKVLTGGLESKTLHFVKRFFNAARCFDDNKSLTIIANLSLNTGNSADDFLANQLSSLANVKVVLSEEQAKMRLYPSIDFEKSKSEESLFGEKETPSSYDSAVAYASEKGVTALHDLLKNSNDEESLQKSLKENMR